MDWSVLEKVGIAGVAVVAIWVMYKVFTLFMNQWGNSTDALNRNTEGYRHLARILETSHERDIEFQKELLTLSKDTNRKVDELHTELVKQKYQGGKYHE